MDKVIAELLPLTADSSKFDKVFTKVSSDNLPYPNVNEVSIYCLDILKKYITFVLHFEICNINVI